MNTSEIKREAVQAAAFRCGHCGYSAELPPETLGKKAKCPECGEITRVRSAEPLILAETTQEMDRESQESQQEGTDVDSLAMSYLGRVQQEHSHRKTVALESMGTERCPHCRQLMPVKVSGPKPAPLVLAKSAPSPVKPVASQAQRAPAPVTPALAASGPAAAPSKPAPTQKPPRPSPLSGARSSTVPVRAASDPTMRCPYCRETILLAARKCKHCGEYLDDTLRCLSEPNNNNSSNSNRREGSHRNAPEGTGYTLMQEIWYRVGWMKLAIAVFAVGGLVYAAAHFMGSKSGPAGTAGAVADATADASGSESGGAASGEGKSSPAKDSLDKLTDKLKKQLQGTMIAGPDASVLDFESSEKGIVPWSCELTGSGKNLKGRVTVPFKLDRSQKRLPSFRGRYVLELALKKGRWELQFVQQETRATVTGGVETLAEDWSLAMQPDTDNAVKHFKKTLSSVAPSPEDNG